MSEPKHTLFVYRWCTPDNRFFLGTLTGVVLLMATFLLISAKPEPEIIVESPAACQKIAKASRDFIYVFDHHNTFHYPHYEGLKRAVLEYNEYQ